jgi:heme/copper-type cytochrome/quinol oxidase subunit 3
MPTPELRVFTRELPQPSPRLLPDAVLGTVMVVLVEAMLFAGFISAFTILKASYLPGQWPPPDQPRLPIEATAVNSLVLLASGVVLWHAGRVFELDRARAGRWLVGALLLGSVFVGVQGVEWVRLVAEGLTLRSSTFGAFFYVIVGAHALHAIPALIVLARQAWLHRSGRLTAEGFAASRLFWYFVVLVWPVLYWQVYL